MNWNQFFVGCLCFVILTAGSFAAEKTTARVVLSVAQARPGDTVWAGVELRMPPRWHTYWRNAGESGMATKIDWQLPDGVTAGEIQWPVPEKLTEHGLTTYIYHDAAALLIPLRLSEKLRPGSVVVVKASVSWLECEKVCLPGSSEVQATLAIEADSKPGPGAALISLWKQKLPAPNAAISVQARWEKSTTDDSRPFRIEWVAAGNPASADFFPYGSDDFEVAGATERWNVDGGKIELRKTVKKFGDRWPTQIQGLIVIKQKAEGEPEATPVTLNLP